MSDESCLFSNEPLAIFSNDPEKTFQLPLGQEREFFENVHLSQISKVKNIEIQESI